ncbi:UNVERIFIED_CONTAM: Retrovirus-related Pol polyprotein from type-2 retrotransposable element R2DM [Sesamum radiatum]|uniref:Retrovirus-related Pol polyprotein from type-2 retrotransposable element R2DM n=1 Tax=Sesamum radiatum TaxID=300843 RepID=A0AAW2V1D2_SESRA
MLRQLNHTIIALVPKSEHSPSVADYRPISCCNVIYKVITKIIADRLSPALEKLIDSSQAAFVGGRNITDNIFLAQEMVRQYSRKRISPRCTINVDLRKAFDSVSWTFLSRVLHGHDFPPIFISWIMECVSTTSFSVALNGSLHGLFPGKKGLRQGDPMSPALFVLCMEYFSRLIKRNTSNSDFNFQPKCIQDDILDEVLAMTEFARGHMPVRHLGIPLAAQRLSFTDYSPLVDQIAGCIHKWIAKSLSFAGRLELIRSIIQGVECFWLQIFPLLVAVIEKIHRLCRAFLWNSKRAPVAWEDICHLKEESGLDAAIRHMAEWTDSKGLVTSKAYEYFRPKLPRQPWKASIWKAFIPPKYSFILWLGLRERLATRDRLAFLHEDPSCSLCINSKKSAKHLFFECPFSVYVWSHIRQWFGITRRMSTLLSAVKWLRKGKIGSSVQNKARHLALACTVYSLWRHRNEIIFEGKAPNPNGLVISIKITVYRLILTLFHKDYDCTSIHIVDLLYLSGYARSIL